jgi:DNA-binding CsgD family transcriptional regulator
VIGKIYDASVDASLWPGVIEQITDLMTGQIGVLTGPLAPPPAPCRVVSARASAEMLRLYAERFREINPIARACAALPVGTPATDRMLVPRTEFRRSEFYNDFMRPMQSETWIGVVLIRGATAQLTVSRTVRQPEWQADDIALFARLVPHLRRAIGIGQRLSRADLGRATNQMELLNTLAHAVLLLDGDGRVLFANMAAETQLGEGGALTVLGGLLHAATPACSAALLAAIARIDRSPDHAAGDALVLPDPAGGRPLHAVLAPASFAIDWPLASRPSVMMLLGYGPIASAVPAVGKVSGQPIKLSPREHDCLLSIAGGRSSKRIAKELGLSPYTVDQYVDSAMRKLNATSRAAAVAKAYALGLVA